MSMKNRILDLIDKALYAPVPKKTIDGQTYILEQIYGTKESAERLAEQLRKKGNLVRVDDRTGTWHYWYVWSRRKD